MAEQISYAWLTGLVLIGLSSGFLSGMLGIGGGVIIVPCLILLFELTGSYAPGSVTLVAVGTSLACIIFTSLSAAYTQARAGMVRWPLFQRLVIFFAVGSFCAGLLAPQLNAAVLRTLIGIFLLCVAFVMLTNWKPSPHRSFPGHPGGAGIGFGGGMIAGIAGIAGGNVIVPTLVYFNTPVHNATATSSALGVPIAAAGAMSYAFFNSSSFSSSFFSSSSFNSSIVGPQQAVATIGENWQLGYVDGLSFVVITLAAVLTAPLGVRIAHKVPAATLKKSFGVLLIFVAARMLYTAARL